MFESLSTRSLFRVIETVLTRITTQGEREGERGRGREEVSRSGGTSSESSVTAASRAALSWLQNRTGAAGPGRLLVLGRSMGVAVAARLAADASSQVRTAEADAVFARCL